MLRHAMMMHYSKTGTHTSETSARSLQAWGTMTMLSGIIFLESIQMMGRKHNTSMTRYLHIQAEPAINSYAAKMFNHGTYAFLPNETVPIIDVNGDD
jgi:hypothetical protein